MSHVQRRRSHKLYPLLALLAGVVMLMRGWSTVHVFNDTVDEPFHIAAAVTLIENARLVDGSETPPVARLVQGLALRIAGVQTKTILRDRTIRENLRAFDVGTEILLKGPVPYWRVLAVARGATLFFGAVVLVYVYLLGRWAGGPAVGMLATVFCSSDPTLIAHSALATSDAAAAACFLAATYHSLRWIFAPDLIRAATAGAALGIAIGAKFSCLALLPIIVLVIGWRIWTRRARGPQLRRGLIGGLFAVAVVAFFSLWACYLFDVGTLADSEMVNGGRWRWMNPRLANLTIPMPSLPLGFLLLQRHNVAEHPAYLLGQVRVGGWWYYFPVALAAKSTVALLAGMIAATALAISRPRRARISVALLTPIAVLLAIAMNSSIQIGVRYLLPIIPLFYVLIALQLCRARWIVVLIVLIAMSFAETGVRHPDYLSFMNIVARRASQKPPILLDSNVDWGQDIARLGRWLRDEHPNTPYETRLFCSASATAIPDSNLRVNRLRDLRAGLIIVSKNVKFRLYTLGDPRFKMNEQVLQLPDVVYTTRPIALIGDSLEVYDLSATPQPEGGTTNAGTEKEMPAK